MSAPSRVLEQLDCALTTNEDIYTVPAGRRARVHVSAVNRTAASIDVRVALRPLGASLTDDHYFAYDVTLYPNQDTFLGSEYIPIYLEATDVVTVYSSAVDVTFTVTGMEEDTPIE